MALPRKLKTMNLFNAGASYIGEVTSVTLPKLARKLDEYRGAGMDGSVKIDMGMEAMELEFATGGPMLDILKQYALVGVAGTFLRFAGGYQNDATGEVTAVEVTVRGRHEEIDQGEQKVGEGGEMKVKTACVYYRLDWDGATVIEIDILNGVLMVDGVDRYAALRAAVV